MEGFSSYIWQRVKSFLFERALEMSADVFAKAGQISLEYISFSACHSTICYMVLM